jgi:FMN phosphatase YigB (HAD superfamily)
VRKPGAVFFHKLSELAGCGADEIVLVGDDYANDYLGAQAAGLRAVLLDPTGRWPAATERIRRLDDLA